jgi:hypothetical protein
MNEIVELTAAEMDLVAGGSLVNNNINVINNIITVIFNTFIFNNNSSNFATGVNEIGVSAANTVPTSAGIGAIVGL